MEVPVLLTFLLILLIIVILFKREIKAVISYGIIFILLYGAWQYGGWGKWIVIGFILIIVASFIGGIISGIKEMKRGEQNNRDIEKREL